MAVGWDCKECGEPLEARGLDDLQEIAREHYAEAHPEQEFSAGQLLVELTQHSYEA